MRRLGGLIEWGRIGCVATVTCLGLTVRGWCQSGGAGPSSPSIAAFHVGFESNEPGWIDEGGDVKRVIRFHDRATASAHSGQHSERIGITATGGTHLYFGYPIGRA